MAEETIKEKTLRVARQDPFLTIEEIAEEVSTTPRYVRTILSEAKLSLMELRKEYAKRMEKKLQPTVERPIGPIDPELQVRRITDASTAKWLLVGEDEELWQVSQRQRVGTTLAYVQITTYKEITLNSKVDSVRQLLLSGNTCKIMQKNQWVEVVESIPELRRILQVNNKQPLLKLYTLLYNDEQQPIALETMWLPSEGIFLKWGSEFPEITLELGS